MTRRLLIVDDDRDFADSLGDFLEPAGYTIFMAGTAEAAPVVLAESGAPVALLDIRLGAASGVDLLGRLREIRPDLVGVIMTAHVESETVIRALRNGAYDYVDKSCHPSELVAVLDRCYEKVQLRAEREAAIAELREAKEAAEAANRAKSDFLATMSHELRTPLNAIIGFSEIIIAKTLGPLGPAVYEGYVRDINASGIHLLEIINDILDLSKAEAGHLELVEDWVDIASVIAASVRLLRPRAEQAGVELAVDVPSDLPHLYGDERKLKQILINLLSNAVKFTPQGGSVRVDAGTDGGGGLFVRVVDTGIGMTAEEIPKALEPFRQIDNRLARKYDGTGLGLPLTAAMLRLHGGALTIESAPGAGTTATASFPRERAQLAAEAAE